MKRKSVNKLSFPEIWFYFFVLTENKDISTILMKETFDDFIRSDYLNSNRKDYLNSLFLFAKRNCKEYMRLTFGIDPYTEQNHFNAEIYARICAELLQVKLMRKKGITTRNNC